MMGTCVALVVLFLSSDLEAQCQMCRTALTQSEEGQRWGRGINAGIMLLLAAPFLIAFSALLVIYPAAVRGWTGEIRARGTERLRHFRSVARTLPKMKAFHNRTGN
jgi:hypothetical protein